MAVWLCAVQWLPTVSFITERITQQERGECNQVVLMGALVTVGRIRAKADQRRVQIVTGVQGDEQSE